MNDFAFVRLVFHEVEPSAGFADWLAEHEMSVAFTNGNRLFLVGPGRDGDLAVVERQYGTCTALTAQGPDTLYLATRYQIWRLENVLPAGRFTDDGHDRLYVPQTAWTTGVLGVHDLAVDGAGRLVFVSGGFSCLATVSETLNFEPLWQPPFITALVPEDRCRLTGVALVDGQPVYVTSASQADSADGWRERQRDGGVVLALPDGSVVVAGLSMPYSPVVHEGRLWVANGGSGELGAVDVERGTFEAVAAMPGFVRGLAVHGHHAVVGVSRPGWGETFAGLAVDERLSRTGEAAVCGVFVVNLVTGRVEHSMVLAGVAPDVGDVALLPGARLPAAVTFHGDEVETLVTLP